MGACCFGGNAGSPLSSHRVSTQGPGSPTHSMISSSMVGCSSPHNNHNSNSHAHSKIPQVDFRIRARERALQALDESISSGEVIIPTAKWRRQYMHTHAVGPAAARTIANRLLSEHNMTTLDLRALGMGDEGIDHLAPVLFQDPKIERIIISDNGLTDESIRMLVPVMVEYGHHSAAKLFVISENPITPRGIEALATALPSLEQLEQLEIGPGDTCLEESAEDMIQLGDDTVHALTNLFNPSSSIKTLVYNGVGAHASRLCDFSPDGFGQLLERCVTNSRLSSLFLQDCYTTKLSWKAPADGMSDEHKANNNSTWRSIISRGLRPSSSNDAEPSEEPHVSDRTSDQIRADVTAINLEPIRKLSLGIRSAHTHLTTLALRFPFSDEAMQLLCHGISRATMLANLSLRGCDLSANALRTLAVALTSNRSISTLDVSYQSAMIAHPLVLAEMRSSSRRRGSWSSFSDLRVPQAGDCIPTKEERDRPLLPLIQALHTNRTLSELMMIGINITTDDIEEICASIEQNNNRVLVDVSYSSSGCDALNMKLDNFLMANRERNIKTNLEASGVSTRGAGATTNSTATTTHLLDDRSEITHYNSNNNIGHSTVAQSTIGGESRYDRNSLELSLSTSNTHFCAGNDSVVGKTIPLSSSTRPIDKAGAYSLSSSLSRSPVEVSVGDVDVCSAIRDNRNSVSNKNIMQQLSPAGSDVTAPYMSHTARIIPKLHIGETRNSNNDDTS